MDQELLLQNHGEDAPSGEDLEYDPTFAELEIAAQLGEERQAGDEIIAGVEPDYKEVAKLALNVLERSHDLRAGVFLSQAQLRLKGMPGFAEVTTFIKQMLEDYWGSCHPQLDADDDDDPTMRVNAVFALADNDRILKALRMAPLTKSRTFGMMSLRDIAVADGEITPPSDMDSVPDASSVAAAPARKRRRSRRTPRLAGCGRKDIGQFPARAMGCACVGSARPSLSRRRGPRSRPTGREWARPVRRTGSAGCR